jgi:hypothetical protein
MRCNLLRIHKGKGNVHFRSMRVAHALLAIAILTITPLFAQSTLQQPIQSSKSTTSSTLPTSQGKSIFAYVNELAGLSRLGNADATKELTRQMFRNSGIPSEIADSFGYTDRIVQAEAAYQNGMHAPIHEADIVKAFNNLANTVGAPQWVHTNQAEVRKWRMRLLATYPRLIASQEPPDANGHYVALSENMRPAEASFIALTLSYQKHYNADFQFTDEEQAQNTKLDAAALKAKHMQRVQDFGSLLREQSSKDSVLGLRTATDNFFDDLGIHQVSKVGTIEPPKSGPIALQKGGR